MTGERAARRSLPRRPGNSSSPIGPPPATWLRPSLPAREARHCASPLSTRRAGRLATASSIWRSCLAGVA
eukprot:15346219-Alexandrium_andersonii.AAC.1